MTVSYPASQHIFIRDAIREKLREQFLDEVKIHGGTDEETETFRIIEYVAKNDSATRDEVAGFINMVPKTVTEKAQLLKGLGILRSDKNGYHFTAKGVRFLRRWLPERRQVTDVTDVSGPVRTKELTPAPDDVEPLLSHIGGNMSNIGNLEKMLQTGEALGVRLQKENGGKPITTMVFYGAAERELEWSKRNHNTDITPDALPTTFMR